ncbi:MAG TPA: magnesium transporter [Pseudomonadales bacterium]|nr:magnesium transporter [Pseudomonadales bacterium]
MSLEVQDQLQSILRAADAGTLDDVLYLLRSLSDADSARLIESAPPRLRRILWELLDAEQAPSVLQYIHEDARSELIQELEPEQLLAAAEGLETDDFADILQQLPEEVSRELLDAMDARDRERLERVLSYPEDTAGGIMNTDAITVRPRHSLELVLRYLRRYTRLPGATDLLIVVNTDYEYVGTLPLDRLLTSDPALTVREVMDTHVPAIPVAMADSEVADIFAREDLVSAAVVDDEDRVVGRITIDDVVDVIIEDANIQFMGRAGLMEDEDTFAPILRTTRRRAVWLGINLATAFLAAAVINLFQDTIAKVVALAILMPIVASMGGIAGTQTLTLVVRGMALGHVGAANLGWLMNRELVVGLINGVLWASLVAVCAALVFQDPLLGAIIAAALVINMLVAAVAGALLPSTLERMHIDPAIAGGVVLTTITDVTGFFCFLGLAALAYG